MSFGGFGFFEMGDDEALDPEDFDSPFEFIQALIGAVSPDTLERNIKMLSAVWGAKTGRNPRYLFADLMAQTGDDELWEKILLPRAQELFSFAKTPAKASSSEDVISSADADDLRRMFEADEGRRGHHRQFTVKPDGETEPEEAPDTE